MTKQCAREESVLAHRIDSLLRANRLLGVVILFLFVLLFLGGASAGPTVENVLRARKFELVDDQGRVRAELAIDKDGSAGLFVRDEKNRVRATVIHDPSQSALYLLDEEGTIRLGAAQFAHGGGGYALHGPKSKGAAALYYKDKGTLTLYAPDGHVTQKWPAP